jgi:hypothetical protein
MAALAAIEVCNEHFNNLIALFVSWLLLLPVVISYRFKIKIRNT